jgi:hypothetical protein
VFANITDRAETSNFPFIHSGPNVGNFAPYSETWNIEGEHSVTQFLRLRVNYLNSNSYGVVTLTPKWCKDKTLWCWAAEASLDIASSN